MRRGSRPTLSYSLLLKILVVLAAVDWYVRGPFFDSYIAARHVRPFAILHDRTFGSDLPIFFGALARYSAGVRIAFVGDSTMNAADGLDATTIPYLTGKELRARLGRSDIEAIDASEIGLYGGDALLFIDKLLGHDVDVLVYGVSLRALPRRPVTQYVSRISDELSPADILRLWRAGGSAWLLENLSAEQVLTGFVRTGWATYAYRSSLRQWVWERSGQRLVRKWPALLDALQPAPLQQQAAIAPRAPSAQAYEWPRDDYAGPNSNWRALDLIGRLCRHYAPGRCVIYAGPVNPLGRDTLVEPELYEDYLAFLRMLTGQYALIWRDYSDTMTPADFRPPKYGGLRDPIHLNETGRAKLAALLVQPVAEAIENVTATGRGSTAVPPGR
jgi:hypothetical protein